MNRCGTGHRRMTTHTDIRTTVIVTVTRTIRRATAAEVTPHPLATAVAVTVVGRTAVAVEVVTAAVVETDLQG